ncbi:MAG: AmmeMemoRadiSam system radical SAM enzyme, partial [Thermoproteota archaeon]
TYRFSDIPDTPLESLRKAEGIAREEGMKFVYLGNVPGQGENTYCPNCNELLIERFGLMMSRSRLSGDKCPKCGKRIPIVI